MSQSRRFEHRLALVTGASRGIGAATARAFAAEGAAVAINYREDRSGAEEVKAAIEGAGGLARPFQADVGDPGAVEAMVDAVSDWRGPVDILVNNAAATNRSPFFDVSIDDLDRLWNVNVRGVFHLSQKVARSMAERNRGVIIHVSSILARLAVPNRTTYCLTKGAIESLTRAMALDLAGSGVRVNAVAPGLIATEMLLAGIPDPDRQAALQSYIPGGRFGSTSELADAILYLCSDEASYINGAIIPVDAGLGGREASPP